MKFLVDDFFEISRVQERLKYRVSVHSTEIACPTITLQIPMQLISNWQGCAVCLASYAHLFWHFSWWPIDSIKTSSHQASKPET